MGLFWLFLFRFRINRMHRISISKRTLLLAPTCFRSGNRIGGGLRTTMSAHATSVGGSVGFPAKNFPKERKFCKPHSFHSVHSAIRSRMNGMIFHSFRKQKSSQKNTNTVHSEYSYSGIVPKECTLSVSVGTMTLARAQT